VQHTWKRMRCRPPVIRRPTLQRVRAALLIVIAAALTCSHLGHLDPPNLQPAPRTILGTLAGVGTRIVATLMDVGGGEVLIPTIVLL